MPASNLMTRSWQDQSCLKPTFEQVCSISWGSYIGFRNATNSVNGPRKTIRPRSREPRRAIAKAKGAAGRYNLFPEARQLIFISFNLRSRQFPLAAFVLAPRTSLTFFLLFPNPGFSLYGLSNRSIFWPDWLTLIGDTQSFAITENWGSSLDSIPTASSYSEISKGTVTSPFSGVAVVEGRKAEVN